MVDSSSVPFLPRRLLKTACRRDCIRADDRMRSLTDDDPLKTRMLIADDHPIVLRGLGRVLDPQPDFEVAAERATEPKPSSSHSRGTSTSRSSSLDATHDRLQAAREITHRGPISAC